MLRAPQECMEKYQGVLYKHMNTQNLNPQQKQKQKLGYKNLSIGRRTLQRSLFLTLLLLGTSLS